MTTEMKVLVRLLNLQVYVSNICFKYMFSSNMFSSNMFSSMFTRDRGFMFFRSIFHYTIKLSSHHRSHNEFAVFFKMLARQRQRIHIGRFQKHSDLS